MIIYIIFSYFKSHLILINEQLLFNFLDKIFQKMKELINMIVILILRFLEYSMFPYEILITLLYLLGSSSGNKGMVWIYILNNKKKKEKKHFP